MTAVKCKQEFKTLIDFSNTKRKVSKNLVKQLLKSADFTTWHGEGNEVTHTTYDIIVGSYKIRLILNLMLQWSDYPMYSPRHNNSKLKEYGSFFIELYEKKRNNYQLISIDQDNRFKQNYWSSMRSTNLVDVIIHCSRLNRLKAFS